MIENTLNTKKKLKLILIITFFFMIICSTAVYAADNCPYCGAVGSGALDYTKIDDNQCGIKFTCTGVLHHTYYIDITNHSFKGSAATCTQDSTLECTLCGYKRVQSALGHSFTDTVWGSPGEDYQGHCYTTACSRCGATASKWNDHSWNAWQVESSTQHKRTCSRDSYHIQLGTHEDTDGDGTCDDCGYQMHVHSWSTSYSTSTTQHWKTCTSCGAEQPGTRGDHTGGTATCTEAKKCITCGASYGTALGHSYSDNWSSDDSQHWKACTRCGTKSSVANHIWNSGTVTKDSTCTATGTKTYTCTTCNKTKTEDIPMKAHDYASEWTSDGTYHWHKCKNCSATTGQAAHTGGTATCVAKKVCSTCSTLYGEIDSTNHDWGSWVEISETQHQRTCNRNNTHKETGSHADNNGDGKCDVCPKIMRVDATLTIASPLKVQYGDTVTFSYTYTGDATPTVLVSSTVASVTINAGAKTISVTGNSVGSTTLTISAAETSRYFATSATATIEVSRKTINVPTGKTGLKYTGDVQTGVDSGTGYSLSGQTTGTNAGSYTAYANVDNNHIWSDNTTGQKTITWSIAKANATITLANKTATYTGNAISIDSVTAKGVKGETLSNGIIYTYYTNAGCTTPTSSTNGGASASGQPPVNAGTYYVTATVAEGGNYARTVSSAAILTISPRDISSASFSVSPTSTPYTGSAITVTTTLTLDGKTLVPNTDYTIDYLNNTNAGSATVTVTGKGNYSGSKSTSFTITQVTPTIILTAKTVNYNGTAISIDAATVKGVNNTTLTNQSITYTYYVDAACNNVTTAANSGASGNGQPPVNAGTYYVKATVAATTNYTANTSEAVILKINKLTPQITITGKTSYYTGSPISVDAATVTGLNGATLTGQSITYTYYTDANCQNPTTAENGASTNGGAPVRAGTYYVTATVAETTNYNSATSAKVTLIINKYATTITPSVNSIGIMVTKETTFDFTYNGDGQVTATANENVCTVTVDNNVKKVSVKTTGVGQTTITLTAPATERYLGTSATVSIDVVRIPIAGKVTMNKNTAAGEVYTEGTWTNQDVYINLDTSETLSTDTTVYKVTGAATLDNQKGANTFKNQGTYTITVTTTDKYGNTAQRTQTVQIDKTPPSVGSLLMLKNNEAGDAYQNNTWTEANVWLSPVPGVDVGDASYNSGHAHTTYTVSGTSIVNAENANTLNTDGIYSVTVTTTDNAGNSVSNSSNPYKIMIDKTNPKAGTIQLILVDEDGNKIRDYDVKAGDSWTKENIKIIPNNDGADIPTNGVMSGFKSTTYEIDGPTDIKSFDGELIFKDNGVYTITVTTTDNVNRISQNIYEIYIDKTVPRPGNVTLKKNDANGEEYLDGTWTNTDVYVEVENGSDMGSGHNNTKYEIKGSTNVSKKAGETTTLTAEGESTLVVTTTDNAGNVSTREFIIKIDKQGPDVTVGNIKYPADAKITLADSRSGIEYWAVASSNTPPQNTATEKATSGNILNIWYPVDNTKNLSVTFSNLNVGTYYAWGKDQTGNVRSTSFTVSPKEIAVVWGETNLKFNFKPQAPTATVNTGVGDEKITLKVSGEKTNVGTYTATASIESITGGNANKDNYTLTNTTTQFKILPDPNMKFNVKFEEPDTDYEWDGTPKEPKVKVTVEVDGEEHELEEGKDFKVDYENNVEPGTGKVVITGLGDENGNDDGDGDGESNGNFGGLTGEIEFTIKKAHTRNAKVLMENYYYEGKELPTPSIEDAANKEALNVTYYYNAKESNEGGTPWSNVTTTTDIPAGTYFMYAVIEESTHYQKETTAVSEFMVMPQDIIDPIVENKIYNGQEQTGVYGGMGVKLTGQTTGTAVGRYVAYGELLNSNYTWTKSEEKVEYVWYILPREIGELNVTLEPDRYTYDGTAKEPKVTVTMTVQKEDGTEQTITLQQGIDFEVAYRNNVNAGTADVIVSGIGNYTGSRTDHFQIDRQRLSRIELTQTDYPYTGSEIIPEVIVYNEKGEILEKGKDYEVYCTNNVEVGTAIVGAVGMGNYRGSVETQFNIVGSLLSNAQIEILGTPYVYDGKEKKPQVRVRLDDKELFRGRDFEVEYLNNINASEDAEKNNETEKLPTVKIVGIGKYRGEATKTFTIMKATRKINVAPGKAVVKGKTGNLEYEYTGELGEMKVTIGDNTIAEVISKSYSTKDSIEIRGKAEGVCSLSIKVVESTNYKELAKTVQVTVFKKENVGLDSTNGGTEKDPGVDPSHSGDTNPEDTQTKYEPNNTYPIYGYVIINDDDEYTNSPNVALSLSVDFGNHMYISEDNKVPDIDADGWQEYSKKMPWTFSNKDEGEKRIYVWFKDNYGNMSSMATDSIILDYDCNYGARDSVILDKTPIDVTPPLTKYAKYDENTLDIELTLRQEDVMVNGVRSGVDKSTIKYGYRLTSSNKKGTEDAYTWFDDPLIKGLLYNTTYSFVTMGCDRAGNGPTISEERVIQTTAQYIPEIKLKDRNAVYNRAIQEIGEAEVVLINDVEVTGIMEYKYYIDKSCEEKYLTTPARDGSLEVGSAPSNPGTYYVIATLKNDLVYVENSSNIAILRIGWNISKTEDDDVFASVERLNPDDPDDKAEYKLNVHGNGDMADLDELLERNGDGDLVYWEDYKDDIVELEINDPKNPNDGVTNIGDEMFKDMPNLGEIVIPDTVTDIGEDAFKGDKGVDKKVVIPPSVEEIGPGAFSGTNIPEFEVEDGNQNYSDKDGCLTDKDEKRLEAYPNGKLNDPDDPESGYVEKYRIPDGIEEVGESAFEGTDHLKDVVIPDGVQAVEPNAFRDSTLEQVEFEDLMKPDSTKDLVGKKEKRDEDGNIIEEAKPPVGENAFAGLPDDSIIYTFSEDIANEVKDGLPEGSKTKVYWPPEIIGPNTTGLKGPYDMNGVIGETVKFTVNVKAGYPQETDYQWFETDNDKVDLTDEERLAGTEISGANSDTYTTPSLTDNNDKYYYVRVYNDEYYYKRGYSNSRKAHLTMLPDERANYVVERTGDNEKESNKFVFERLQDALDFAQDGDVIRPRHDVDDEVDATLRGKDVTLDTSDYTITVDGTITVEDDAKLEITGNSNGGITKKEGSEKGDYVIENNGELTVSGGNITNPSGKGIETNKDSKLTVEGGTISTGDTGITANDADVNITGDAEIKVESDKDNVSGVELNGETKFNMDSGNITVENTGEKEGNTYGVHVNGTGKGETNITGGTITATSNSDNNTASGLGNSGNTDVHISGGTITGSDNGIVNEETNNGGDLYITGGTVKGGDCGVLNDAEKAKVVLGKQGGEIEEEPTIVGENVAVFNTGKDDTLEMYDGTLYSHSDTLIYEGKDGEEMNKDIHDHLYTEDGRKKFTTEDSYTLHVTENETYGGEGGYVKGTLNKNTKANIDKQPQDQYVEEGEKGQFEVQVSGGEPDDYQFEWEVSTDGGKTWHKVTDGDGGDTNIYHTPYVDQNMNGFKYRCKITNGDQVQYTNEVTLRVINRKDSESLRPIIRVVYTNGRKVEERADGTKIVNMQVIVTTFEEAKEIKLNGISIKDISELSLNSGNLEISKDPNSPTMITREQETVDENGDKTTVQKVMEYTYTYNLVLYRNEVITIDAEDIAGRKSTDTQPVELFYDIKVEYYLSKLTDANRDLTITFYSNKRVKPIQSISESYSNGLYQDLIPEENAEYAYRYTLKLEKAIPETEFYFIDEYENRARVVIPAIARVKYKEVKFSDNTLEMNDLTVQDAYELGQNLENMTEVNGNQVTQTRYGTNSMQADMFMSRARDIGALEILNASTKASKYDGVYTSNIDKSSLAKEDIYGSQSDGRDEFIAAAAKDILENILSSENSKYRDIITKDLSLYKGMIFDAFNVNDANPYMYKSRDSITNIGTEIKENASFRATIVGR